MTNQFSQIKWGRVTWTTLIVCGASFLIVFLIVTAYATSLAVQARGAPDQTMIQAFASQYAPWVGPISLILFTFLGAMRMARFVRTAAQIHGLILGVLVSLVNIVLGSVGSFSLTTLLTTVLLIGSGWLGGRLSTPKE